MPSTIQFVPKNIDLGHGELIPLRKRSAGGFETHSGTPVSTATADTTLDDSGQVVGSRAFTWFKDSPYLYVRYPQQDQRL